MACSSKKPNQTVVLTSGQTCPPAVSLLENNEERENTFLGNQRQAIERCFQEFCQKNSLTVAPLKWDAIPQTENGFSCSLFQLAVLNRNQMPAGLNVPAWAAELATQWKPFLTQQFENSFFIENIRGYLNFYPNSAQYFQTLIQEILAAGENYGKGMPKTEKVMIEYSQPNTHHSFHMGHARNTVLGESLARIMQFAGYETLRAAYPGDLGLGVITVLWAYQKFYLGQEPEGIHERGQWLAKIYAEASELLRPKEDETPAEKELREGYENERRDIYQKLIQGDPEITNLWLKTRAWSLAELKDIHQLLNVKIDHWFYESELEKEAQDLTAEMVEKGVATKQGEAEKAVVIDIDKQLGLEKETYRTNVLLRSDGTSLYLTKDLALAKIKFEKYQIDRSVYVVDSRQELYLQQVFAILKIMGFPQAKNCQHLTYGYVSLPDGAMSARKGRTVFFKPVADAATKRVLEIMAEQKKSPALDPQKQQEVAQKIGIGSLVYSLLAVENNRDQVFDLEKALDFEGRTGAYIQNAIVRGNSILKKAPHFVEENPPRYDYELNLTEKELLQQLSEFPLLVQKAAIESRPLVIASYAYKLASIFQHFYHTVSVLVTKDAAQKSARLQIIAATKQTLTNALDLLGIAAPDVM